MTKNEEMRIIEGFRKVYEAFPNGELSTPDPPLPDFVVITDSGKRIGIEMTEIFISSTLKQQSSVKDRVTNKLVEVLQNRLSYRFTMNVFIDPDRPMQMARFSALIEELADICVDEFGELVHNTWGEIEHIDMDFADAEPHIVHIIRARGYRNLPAGIGRIRIHRYDGLPYSYNSRSEGGTVPDLTIDAIQDILAKKENLLKRQPALDENWLVIREGNYYTGTFDAVTIALPIVSSFDKVFLYRTGSDEVIELT